MAPTRVYVGGIPHYVQKREVERFFRGYGQITSVRFYTSLLHRRLFIADHYQKRFRFC